jgi:hypothetical protein
MKIFSRVQSLEHRLFLSEVPKRSIDTSLKPSTIPTQKTFLTWGYLKENVWRQFKKKIAQLLKLRTQWVINEFIRL